MRFDFHPCVLGDLPSYIQLGQALNYLTLSEQTITVNHWQINYSNWGSIPQFLLESTRSTYLAQCILIWLCIQIPNQVLRISHMRRAVRYKKDRNFSFRWKLRKLGFIKNCQEELLGGKFKQLEWGFDRRPSAQPIAKADPLAQDSSPTEEKPRRIIALYRLDGKYTAQALAMNGRAA